MGGWNRRSTLAQEPHFACRSLIYPITFISSFTQLFWMGTKLPLTDGFFFSLIHISQTVKNIEKSKHFRRSRVKFYILAKFYDCKMTDRKFCGEQNHDIPDGFLFSFLYVSLPIAFHHTKCGEGEIDNGHMKPIPFFWSSLRNIMRWELRISSEVGPQSCCYLIKNIVVLFTWSVTKMVIQHNIDFINEVNGIVYRSVREDDFDAVVDFFFDVFLKGLQGWMNPLTWDWQSTHFSDEPATISFGGYKSRNERLESDMRDVLKYGVSIIAEDPSNGNRLVGIRTAYTIERFIG